MDIFACIEDDFFCKLISEVAIPVIMLLIGYLLGGKEDKRRRLLEKKKELFNIIREILNDAVEFHDIISKATHVPIPQNLESNAKDEELRKEIMNKFEKLEKIFLATWYLFDLKIKKELAELVQKASEYHEEFYSLSVGVDLSEKLKKFYAKKTEFNNSIEKVGEILKDKNKEI